MKLMNMRKILLIFVFCLGLLWTRSLPAMPERPLFFPDVQKHWAQKSIDTWVERGYLSGYSDGKFKPNNPITRAEFCTFINRIFGYSKTSPLAFSDVSEGKWYAQELSKAVGCGYLHGYPDGTIRPNGKITRQEIAAILTKILSLEYIEQDVLAKFKDRESISAWGALAVNTVAKYKYMRGFPNQTFQPDGVMTRAEAMTILDRVVGTLYAWPGIYGPTYDVMVVQGNVTINTRNVTLRNMVIKGNLYLTDGIDDGNVALVNVEVQGITKVSGGVLLNNSTLASVIVDTANRSKLRLLAQGTAAIGPLDVRTEVILEEANLIGTGFNDVSFNVPQGSKLEMKGTFKQVDVKSPKVKLSFMQGVMESLNLDLAAYETEVVLFSKAIVKKIQVINKALIKGWGQIDFADVYANYSVFEIIPKKMQMALDARVIMNGEVITSDREFASSGGVTTNNTKMPPSFLKGYPNVRYVQTTSFDLLLAADQYVNAHYVVLEAGARMPSVKDVMAGQDANGRDVAKGCYGRADFIANAIVSMSIKGLQEATEYDVFIVLENKSGDVAAVTKYTVKTTDSRYGGLGGKVSTSGGKALSGVEVSVKEGDTVVASTTTNVEGEYLFQDLRVGAYTVEFSKVGYHTERFVNLKIVGGKTRSNINIGYFRIDLN